MKSLRLTPTPRQRDDTVWGGGFQVDSDRRGLPLTAWHQPIQLVMPGGLQGFRERVLRLDVRVSHLLVEPVRSRSRGTRPQANHRTSFLPGPVLGLRHEHPANSLPPAAPVDHQSANHDERFCLDVFKNRRVQPSSSAPIDFSHEKQLVGRRKDAPEPWPQRRRCDVIAQLRRQARDVVRVRLASRSYAHWHVNHRRESGAPADRVRDDGVHPPDAGGVPLGALRTPYDMSARRSVNTNRSIGVRPHRHKSATSLDTGIGSGPAGLSFENTFERSIIRSSVRQCGRAFDRYF